FSVQALPELDHRALQRALLHRRERPPIEAPEVRRGFFSLLFVLAYRDGARGVNRFRAQVKVLRIIRSFSLELCRGYLQSKRLNFVPSSVNIVGERVQPAEN